MGNSPIRTTCVIQAKKILAADMYSFYDCAFRAILCSSFDVLGVVSNIFC